MLRGRERVRETSRARGYDAERKRAAAAAVLLSDRPELGMRSAQH